MGMLGALYSMLVWDIFQDDLSAIFAARLLFRNLLLETAFVACVDPREAHCS